MSSGTGATQGKRAHWLIERRLRVYPRILLTMFSLTALIYAATFQNGVDGLGRPPGTDFIAFWSAARAVVTDSGVDPWDVEALFALQRDHFPGLSKPTAWVYPPTMLLLVWPLGHLAHGPALVVWTGLGLLAFLATLRVVVGRVRLAWPLVLAFPGLWIGVAHGQTQFIVASLVGGSLLLLGRHPVLAGVLIGLMTVKPHLAVLFPLVLIAGGHWRTFVAAALTSVGSFALAAAAFGPASIRSWFDGMGLVGAAIDEQVLPVHKFVTPYAGLQLVAVPQQVALLVHVAVAIVAGWVVWVIWRRTDDLRIRGSALVVGTFLVTPYAADYDLALLAFPLAWTALVGLERGWMRRDRNLLVIGWVLPIVCAPLAFLTHVSLTPLVLGVWLQQLWRRTSAATGQQARTPVEG